MRSFPFDLVVFDCDGVLVDSERLINQIESQHIQRLGLAMSPAEARAVFKGHTVSEVAAALAARLGAPLPVEWIYDWGTQIGLGYVRYLQPVRGVREVLTDLRGRGIPLCVASQSPLPRVELSLAVTGLTEVCGERVYAAAMVPRGKPHPDLFLYAAARMGADPTRTAVVEDSPSGVVAARSAGMTVFGYAADEDPSALQNAGATTFGSMDELPELLASSSQPPTAPTAVTRLRAAYEAFAGGDARALITLLAADAVYHLPGRHLGGGRLDGRDEILRCLAAAVESCDARPTIRLHAFVAAGDHALSIERFHASRRGQILDQDVTVVWRMANGRCVEMWSRFPDQASCDRFWE